jgi:hypothetical protein
LIKFIKTIDFAIVHMAGFTRDCVDEIILQIGKFTLHTEDMMAAHHHYQTRLLDAGGKVLTAYTKETDDEKVIIGYHNNAKAILTSAPINSLNDLIELARVIQSYSQN